MKIWARSGKYARSKMRNVMNGNNYMPETKIENAKNHVYKNSMGDIPIQIPQSQLIKAALPWNREKYEFPRQARRLCFVLSLLRLIQQQQQQI